MIKSKKAQGLSVNTIVLIILAVIVLVIVIAGFTLGWRSMWDRVTGFFSTTNVDTIVNTCNIQCTTQQTYEFCTAQKKVRVDENLRNNLVSERVSCDPKGKLYECTGSCNDFKDKLPGLECDIDCT